jgi:hypothetical protein
MEKEKTSRKRSTETSPPTPPPPPPPPPLSGPHKKQLRPKDESDPFIRIATYKEREHLFLKSLNESIKLYEAENSQRTPEAPLDLNRMILENLQQQHAGFASEEPVTPPLPEATGGNQNVILNECTNYLSPLMSRTGVSVAAAISTKGALDQLDKLHHMVKQLMTLQEQNIRMQRCIKNVETIHALKLMQNQVSFRLEITALLVMIDNFFHFRSNPTRSTSPIQSSTLNLSRISHFLRQYWRPGGVRAANEPTPNGEDLKNYRSRTDFLKFYFSLVHKEPKQIGAGRRHPPHGAEQGEPIQLRFASPKRHVHVGLQAQSVQVDQSESGLQVGKGQRLAGHQTRPDAGTDQQRSGPLLTRTVHDARRQFGRLGNEFIVGPLPEQCRFGTGHTGRIFRFGRRSV